MAKISSIVLLGASGKDYLFHVWDTEHPHENVAAVYAITRRYQDDAGTPNHRVLYIGQTDNLSTEFDNHPKADCLSLHQANSVCTYFDDNVDSRQAVEQDLIKYYNPVCMG